MKRYAVLFTIVIASVILSYAQQNSPMQQNSPKEMTGWICSSACVTQNAGQAACDASCASNDKSGDAVFVEDNGKVSKISNPDMVKGKMGQKVQAKCQMNKDTESMEILELIHSIR